MRHHDNRGFALPIAVFIMTIAAVLITASTFVGHQEARIGVASKHSADAFYLAEIGMHEAMAEWVYEDYNAIPLWGDTLITDTLAQGIATTRVTRLAEYLYFVESESLITEGGAMLSGAAREAGMVVRVASLDINPPAALTTRGNTEVRGTAEIRGRDQDPGSWTSAMCPDSLVDKPGIMIDNATNIQGAGAGNISGVPRIAEDPTLTDSTFLKFGETTWDDLVDMATIRMGPGAVNTTGPMLTADGRCDTSQQLNWGDPLNPTAPCADYFPIIYFAQDGWIQSGGVGQGIILAEEDLELRGDFLFHGIIIVQGSFETQGSGNRVYGGVMASNADIENQTLTGGSVIRNSTCAVSRSILYNPALTRPRPLMERSWIDLSATRR